MKTILLISPYWKEQHRWMISTTKLADLWQQMGYRVVVACMGDLRSGKWKMESGKCTKKVHVEQVSETLEIHRMQDVFLKDPWNYGIAFGFTRYVLRLVKQQQFDYIVVNKLLFWTSFATIWLRLTGKKVALLTDALVGMTWWPRGWLPKVCAAIYAWTGGWAILLCASKVVFFHPQPPKLLRKLCIVGKSQVIPTGIDSSQFTPRTNEQMNKQVTVTYVGRLESIKGVDDFLAALVPLKQRNPQMHLQVVGWYAECHPLVEQYSRDVQFTGLRDDIDVVLGGTDIFVMPSYSEGLSNAIMEAMSSGCACVVSEVGGNTFLIQNGVSGLAFPAGDRAALASHVQRLLDDPAKRNSLGAAARKRIEEVFDWKQVCKLYEEFFASLERL